MIRMMKMVVLFASGVSHTTHIECVDDVTPEEASRSFRNTIYDNCDQGLKFRYTDPLTKQECYLNLKDVSFVSIEPV